MSGLSKVLVAGGFKAMSKAIDGSMEDVRQAVNEGARTIRNIARRSLRSKNKSGREYYRPKGEKSQKYRASRPGEAPARFTGHLVEHIRVELAKRGKARAVAKVKPTSPHAHLEEFGTVKMAARPFLGPAARQAKEQNFKNIKAATKRAIRAAGQKALSKKGP